MDIAEDPGMAGTDVVPHGPSAANTRDVLFWDDHEPERWSSIVNGKPSQEERVQVYYKMEAHDRVTDRKDSRAIGMCEMAYA